MGISVGPYVTAGVAIAGAGIWLAAAPSTPTPTSAPTVRLASVQSRLAPPLSPPASPTCLGPLCPGDATWRA